MWMRWGWRRVDDVVVVLVVVVVVLLIPRTGLDWVDVTSTATATGLYLSQAGRLVWHTWFETGRTSSN